MKKSNEAPSITELIEQVSELICDSFCEYRHTCDDNCECDWIREGHKCPLDHLY